MNILEKHAPPKQQNGDYTVQDAMRVTGFKGSMSARRWLDTIPELKRIDGVILANGRLGSVWRPLEKTVRRVEKQNI